MSGELTAQRAPLASAVGANMASSSAGGAAAAALPRTTSPPPPPPPLPPRLTPPPPPPPPPPPCVHACMRACVHAHTRDVGVHIESAVGVYIERKNAPICGSGRKSRSALWRGVLGRYYACASCRAAQPRVYVSTSNGRRSSPSTLVPQTLLTAHHDPRYSSTNRLCAPQTTP